MKNKAAASPFEEEPFSFRNVKPSLYSTQSEKRNSVGLKRSPPVSSGGGAMARRKSDSSQPEYSPYLNALAHASRVQSILDHFSGLCLENMKTSVSYEYYLMFSSEEKALTLIRRHSQFRRSALRQCWTALHGPEKCQKLQKEGISPKAQLETVSFLRKP